MELLLLIVLAALALAAFVYVQIRLPRHAQTANQATAVRALLALTGIGLGYVALLTFPELQGVERWLAFLTGFGVAHVPGAFILMLKRERGEYDR